MTSAGPPALRVASSRELQAPFFQALRTMLEGAYEAGFSANDWGHALGGLHVWVEGPTGLIAHGAVVPRALELSAHPTLVGYVEAVATDPLHRRQGLGTAILRRLGELIRERYALGVLCTGHCGFYEPLGWERWRGATYVRTRASLERTPDDDGSIMVLRTPRSPALDLSDDLVASGRPGDVW